MLAWLVLKEPLPPRRIVGDLSDAAQLRLRLELGSPAAVDGRPDRDA